MSNTANLIQNLTYIYALVLFYNIYIFLYQFLETRTSDRTLIGLDQLINLHCNIIPNIHAYDFPKSNLFLF